MASTSSLYVRDGSPESDLSDVQRPSPTMPSADGSAASRRPITDNTDQLDSKIMEYKAQNYGDTQIARMLQQEYGSEYSPKTICTRYRRLRQAKMAANDELLKFREKFWTSAEDDALIKAHNMSQERHQRELAKLNARIFEDTAFTLNDLSNSTFHSAEACKERLADLLAGRAEVHPDDDDDPERRDRDKIRGVAAKLDKQDGGHMMNAGKEEEDDRNIFHGGRRSRPSRARHQQQQQQQQTGGNAQGAAEDDSE